MWFLISLASLLVVGTAFLVYLVFEQNPERVHERLIAGAILCGTLALILIVSIMGMLVVEWVYASSPILSP